MEKFIEQSHALLKARPGARVSTTITHKKVHESDWRVDVTARPTKIVVKTYDPRSKLVYKYKVSRVNELSRILACLGPQDFEHGVTKKRGLASLMSKREYSEAAEGVQKKESKS
ncbi:hypothetical protein DASB73_021720 [Starmerella bacillaris]|uniref:SRP9 domain-containing protein n=1 Tax=Starmerella bacillaris TaxID=1247836 RepID=A0AAV5RKZ8_STABA|nr:hypothetical protein DASB73_021720 [Starmerella bacillaris]